MGRLSKMFILASLAVATLLVAASASAAAGESRESFRPAHFDLRELRSPLSLAEGTQQRKAFEGALTEAGIITVGGVEGLSAIRQAALLGAHLCAGEAPAARTVTFGDGTVRTTLAAVTHGLDNAQEIGLGYGEANSRSTCTDEHLQAMSQMRAITAQVAEAFVARMGEVFDTSDVTLLQSVDGVERYSSFDQIVRAAEHLEHFHSYRSPASVSTREAESQLSIDMHADQGLFIAFVPAMMVDEEGDTSASAGEFLLQTKDGSVSSVDFGDGNKVVIMLGDGVEQYFNPKTRGLQLRAAPHAMSMPESDGARQARAWYGRMFLPPNDALNERMGVSYGRARELMIEDMIENNGSAGIGCSRKLLQDEQPECADNQMYCWMRCMNFTEEVSPAACEAKNLGLQCLSQRLEIWTLEDGHGDYNPTCTDIANAPITALPMIPLRDESCGADFEAFMSAESYNHMLELEPGKHYFLWSVKDGLLHARLAYNDTVGYLSIGPENIGGGRGGMYGSHVVMGIIDPEEDGTDLTFGSPYIGTSVKEYIIHESLSAFRHWSEPIEPVRLQDSEMESTPCYSAMSFVTDNIAGVPLNLTEGENNALIWASHTETYLKGYHGFYGRGHLDIVLNQGATNPTIQSDSGAKSVLAGSPYLPAAALLLATVLAAAGIV